jgi:hypothetical protein
MMLRNLLDEIVRRRLWPILALAVLAAVAAPLFFMKSAPVGAPDAATPAPAPAAAGELPARAQRLLAATGTAAVRGRATGSARDPFEAPAARRATGAAAGAASAATGTGTGTGSASSAAGSSGTATTPAVTPSTPLAPAIVTPKTTKISGPASVDVRFGKSAGGRVHKAVPRLQPYYIHGKLAAVFVKYSPSLNKAVFAISPGLIVSGPVKCRRVNDVCRYLDIPAGSYARLTMVTQDRILVSRRIDVEHIGHGAAGASTTAVAAAAHSENSCLLRLLRAVKPSGAPIARDACER